MQLHDWLDHHVGPEQRNLALAWEIIGKSLGNLGGKSWKSGHWSLGAKLGKEMERERGMQCLVERGGGRVASTFIIDVKKKCDTL